MLLGEKEFAGLGRLLRRYWCWTRGGAMPMTNFSPVANLRPGLSPRLLELHEQYCAVLAAFDALDSLEAAEAVAEVVHRIMHEPAWTAAEVDLKFRVWAERQGAMARRMTI